jgi:hypothetical protein
VRSARSHTEEDFEEMLDLSGWLRSQNMMWRDAHHTDHTSHPDSLLSLGQHGGGRERRGSQLQRNLGAELSSVAVAGAGTAATAAAAAAEDEARDATPPVSAVEFLQTLGSLKVVLTPQPRLCSA